MITFDQSGSIRFDADESFDSGYRRFDEALPWTFDSTRVTFDHVPTPAAFAPATSTGQGYWAPVYWNQAHYAPAYWADTNVTFLPSGKVGGDDIPYRSRRNKGWNKKAWLKKQRLQLDIERTLRNTLYGFDELGVQESFYVEANVHVADEYERILKRLREIDDEEAAALLL